MVKRPVSIGLVQAGSEPLDVDANRSFLASRTEQAFRRGAQVVILPEMSATGYTTDKHGLALAAEPVAGPTTSSWMDLASTYGGYVVGGFCEAYEGELFNTAAIVGPEGVVLHYRKLHLFADEKNAFEPGNLGLPVVRTELAVLGLCVCYDLRFVEVARVLALKGVELLCVPTAWISGFDSVPQEAGICSQAQGAVVQANLNQIFIACASQVGLHGGYRFLGSSVLADPFGDLICGPLSGTEEEDGVVLADMGVVEEAAQRGPLITPRDDRRTDLYGVAIDGTIL